MNKRLLVALLAPMLFQCWARSEIQWRSDPTGGDPSGPFLISDIDGTPFQNGSNGTIGYFIQLIFLGVPQPSNVVLSPTKTNNLVGAPNGVAGTDTVVDVAWIGSGGIGSGTAGILRNQTGEAHVPGGVYYVRVWNAPRATTYTLNDGNESTTIPLFDPITGINPTTGKLLRYGDSQTFTATGNEITVLQFDFRAVSDTPYLVPEPGTFGLMGLGTLGMWLMRRRLRQQA